MRSKPIVESDEYGALEHVDYVSHLDTASTNQDISTLHPLGKEECNQVFKDRVPFVVPVSSQQTADDMSSIHGVSTKLGAHEPEVDLEEGTNTDARVEEQAVAIPDVGCTEPPVQAHTESNVKQSSSRQWLIQFVSNRSDCELFFTALAGASIITLIILLAILFAT